VENQTPVNEANGEGTVNGSFFLGSGEKAVAKVAATKKAFHAPKRLLITHTGAILRGSRLSKNDFRSAGISDRGIKWINALPVLTLCMVPTPAAASSKTELTLSSTKNRSEQSGTENDP
jgi:hypothetical protein